MRGRAKAPGGHPLGALSFPVSGRNANHGPFAGRLALQGRVMRKFTVPPMLSIALLLAGCGSDETVTAEPEDDPALSGALGEPILVDPDLVGQNRANSAASMPSQDG